MGLIEELFGGHSEKFSLICRAIGIEERFLAVFGVLPEPKIFTGTYLNPIAVFGPVAQRRSAVSGTVEHIQFMGEFMIDNIVP